MFANVRINHVGLTVRDLDRTAEFYALLGGEVTAHGHFDAHYMSTALGVHGADLHTRMVKLGPLTLELIQYDAPEGEDYSLRNCDVGASHIAFEVDDLEETQRELTARGLEFFSAPNPIEDGPFVGGAWVYLKDPDGISVELIQPGAKR